MNTSSTIDRVAFRRDVLRRTLTDPTVETRRRERQRRAVAKSNSERARLSNRTTMRFSAWYPVVTGPVSTQIQFDAAANYQTVMVAGLVVMVPFRTKKAAAAWLTERYPAARPVHSWDLTGPEFEGYRREIPDER